MEERVSGKRKRTHEGKGRGKKLKDSKLKDGRERQKKPLIYVSESLANC